MFSENYIEVKIIIEFIKIMFILNTNNTKYIQIILNFFINTLM